MLNAAGEMFQHRSHRQHRRAPVGALDHLALGVERVGLLSELNGEFIDFAGIEHPPGQLGRFTQCDRQHAFGQRVERAAMADLGLGIARFAQHALDRADRLGRAQPARLVEHQPAVGFDRGVRRGVHPAIPRAIQSAMSK